MKERVSRKLAQSWVVPSILVIISGVIVVTVLGVMIAGVFTDPKAVTASSLPSYQARFNLLGGGTTPTTESPSVLPQAGVTINNQFVLRPLSATQKAEVTITAGQAIKIGRTYADAHPFQATPLLASFTSINSVPPPGIPASEANNAHAIQDVPAWIVTFTSDTPQPVIEGEGDTASQTFFHFNVVINASTGAFVLGFFTV